MECVMDAKKEGTQGVGEWADTAIRRKTQN